ncbi:hypothetical protein [Pseudomonas synxantha]|nr:hypothetical protein [Pseudomonas synxantha]
MDLWHGYNRYLHQKVALTFPVTIKNMWLLNDLRRFQSDERIKIILLHVFTVATIAGRSPPTVYAFLNPKFPSATWDFFCLELSTGNNGSDTTCHSKRARCRAK